MKQDEIARVCSGWNGKDRLRLSLRYNCDGWMEADGEGAYFCLTNGMRMQTGEVAKVNVMKYVTYLHDYAGEVVAQVPTDCISNAEIIPLG